ncbi:hypothetical protein ABBQ32_004750 [Trebouxia sp. C0010 RCD-2024]
MAHMQCMHSSFNGCVIALRPQHARLQSARSPIPVTECKESRIGKQPVLIPSGVTVTIKGTHVTVKGPKGQLERTFPDMCDIIQEGNNLKVIKREFSDPAKRRRAYAQHGLIRSLANGMIVGTSEGFAKDLQLIGVGYRGSVAGKTLTMNLGFSHPVVMTIPDDVEVKVTRNTFLNISSYNKESLGDFAASVRAWRPPEPYKGKGIRYKDEVVRRKEGKRGK